MLCNGRPQTIFCMKELQGILDDNKEHLLCNYMWHNSWTLQSRERQGLITNSNKQCSLSQIMAFLRHSSAQEEEAFAGEKFPLALCGIRNLESLNKYWYAACKCTATRTSLDASFQLASSATYFIYRFRNSWKTIIPDIELGWKVWAVNVTDCKDKWQNYSF